MLNINSIPTRYKQIYKKKIGFFFFCFNPFSIHGMTIVDKHSAQVFRYINGSRNIKDICGLMKKHGSGMNEEQIIFALDMLRKHDIINFDGKEYFVMDKTIGYSHTLKILLHLTNQCNFRCTYCFVDKNTHKMNKSIVRTVIHKLYSMYRKYAYEKIIIVISGGEPLLEMSLIHVLLDTINELDPDKKIFETIILTNGSLITEKTARYLKKKDVKVSISLDGLGRINDVTRKFSDGSGTFQFILRSIRIAQKNNILNGVNVTISTRNIRNLPFLAEFFLENNIRMSFSLYRQFNQLCHEELFHDPKVLLRWGKKMMNMVYSYYERKHISHSPLQDHQFFDLKHFPIGFSEHSCSAGKTYLTVNTDGDIKFCLASGIKLARIHDKDFIHTAYKKSTPILQRMSVDKLKECYECNWKYICSGGCMLERMYLDINKPTYKCNIFKAIIPMILDLEAKQLMIKSLNST